MFSAISLLVLACAVTINAQNCPGCTESTIGTVPTYLAVYLPPVVLRPKIPKWQINIHNIGKCVYGVSGLYAVVCESDYNKAPIVYFNSYNQLKVHRTGNLNCYSTVTVTAYCKPRPSPCD